MSEAILKMLAERDRVEQAKKVASTKAIIDPVKRAFETGFSMTLAMAKREGLTPAKRAFVEGVEFASRCGYDPAALDWAWRESIARLDAMERLKAGETSAV